MLSSQIPSKFVEAFAKNAGANFIRSIPVTTADTTAASLDQGFPPATATPVGAGGTPPSIKDMNGILNQVSAWAWWLAAGGGMPKYDSVFAAAVGGYPNGAMLQSATNPGVLWLSVADNNTTDPDGVSAANWQLFGGSGATTGDTKFRPSNDNLLNNAGGWWVRSDSTTVGNPSSNATQLASNIAQGLFTYLWTNFPNSICQLFNSSGAPVSRGASAAADWAANCAIATLDMRGAAIKGLDAMSGAAKGAYSGVPFSTGSATTPGSTAGENTHTLTVGELAAHVHGVPGTATNNVVAGGGPIGIVAGGGTSLATDNGTGNGIANAAHNTVDRSVLGSFYMKV